MSAEGNETPAAPPARPRRARQLALGAGFAALVVLLSWQAWRTTVQKPRDAGRAAAERQFGFDRADVPAPDFRHPAADGSTFAASEHRGEVLFVNFWATWCPPCRDEMPSMIQLGRELSGRFPGRFRMIAVSVDDGWEPVRAYFGGTPPLGLTVTLDAEQATTRAYYCAARGACPESIKFPETYVVDKRGRLVAFVVGPRNWGLPAARTFLERLIEE